MPGSWGVTWPWTLVPRWAWERYVICVRVRSDSVHAARRWSMYFSMSPCDQNWTIFLDGVEIPSRSPHLNSTVMSISRHRCAITADLFDTICTAFFFLSLKFTCFMIILRSLVKDFSYRGQNYNPKPSKRSQVQICNVHKPWKIGIATRGKRSAAILTFQKDPPLSHKGVEVTDQTKPSDHLS